MWHIIYIYIYIYTYYLLSKWFHDFQIFPCLAGSAGRARAGAPRRCRWRGAWRWCGRPWPDAQDTGGVYQQKWGVQTIKIDWKIYRKTWQSLIKHIYIYVYIGLSDYVQYVNMFLKYRGTHGRNTWFYHPTVNSSCGASLRLLQRMGVVPFQ